jgi:MATE family multidrug resistance protein
MSAKPAYQLTQYPPGSFFEIFLIASPLILGLLSSSVMLFADRLLLAHYSIDALNAATSSGTAAYAFIILTMSIASISAVFVGRYQGKGKFQEVGKPVWQMVWYSLLLFPLCLLLCIAAPPLLFYGNLYEYKAAYFSTLLLFTPIFCINMAICGFFTGIGKLRHVLFAHMIANISNIFLDIILINGYGPIPSYGITGAAFATGLSEIAAIVLLLLTFFHPKNRVKYGTHRFAIDPPLLLRSIQVGFPSGLGLSVEVSVFFFFYWLMEKAGQADATIASLVQTLFFLIMCLSDGLSKGVVAVASNFLGAKRYDYIDKLVKSACSLQTLFYLLVSSLILPFTGQIIEFFISYEEKNSFMTAAFFQKASWTYFLMTFYFYLNGLTKVYSGQLTAAGDTRYLLLANILLSVTTLLIPVYVAVEYFSLGVVAGWSIIIFFSFCSLITLFSRYLSKNWIIASERL